MDAIVAVSENWGIGRDNRLLFRIRADLQRFKALTTGHPVVMGRKTLLSFPGGRPLPHRRNIVLSRDLSFAPEGVEMARSAEEALALAGEDAFLIGGESVYRALLPRCERVYVTKVFAAAEADAFFPDLDTDPAWRVERQSEILEENGLRFQYVDYVRVE
jgi:dihydrofolate reductase